MIKRYLVFFIFFLSFSCFASVSNSDQATSTANYANCGQATSTDNPGFCKSFHDIAVCHCTSSGLPSSLCNNISQLYDRMIAVYKTQQKACEYQKDTSVQTCMDDWNCYRLGGRDSQGRLCSSTGDVCPANPALG